MGGAEPSPANLQTHGKEMLIAVDHREFPICYAAMTDRRVADTYKTLPSHEGSLQGLY